jgi:hypothetical protein
MGSGAGLNNTGSDNVAIGTNAGQNPSNKGTFIGYNANTTMAGLTNVTAIGYNAKVAKDNSVILGGTGADSVKVGIHIDTPRAMLDINGTDALIIPVGDDTNYPATPIIGMIRFNADPMKNYLEGYVWDTVSMTYKWLKIKR